MSHPNPSPSHAAVAARGAYLARERKTGVAYVLWFFLASFGAHKFYLHRYGWGVAYLLTLGFVGVGTLIDLFALPGQVRRRNAEISREVTAAITGGHVVPEVGA